MDYLNSLGIDSTNYEQGKTIMSKVNPWSRSLHKKQADKLLPQLVGNENVTVSQSKVNLTCLQKDKSIGEYCFFLHFRIYFIRKCNG